MPGQHALLSASGASIWMECPPSARLVEHLPESVSVYADEGTLAHHIGELIILKNLGRISHSKFQHDLLNLQKNELYSSEMLDYCEGYAAYVIEKFNEEPGSYLDPELRVDISKYVPGGFGTSDAPILRPKSKHLLIIDLKYGKGVPVSAIENKQGKLYLLGALEEYYWIYDIETVEFIIYQPRLDNISSTSSANYTLTVAELKDWAENVLRPAAALAWEGKGDFKPGDHCRFCRAKPTCKALADHTMKTVEAMFQEDEEDEDFNNPQILQPLFLNDAEVSHILKMSDLFKNWIESVEDYAQEQAVKHHKKWPGFKLVEGRSNRKFIDEEEVGSILTIKGYKVPEIYNIKLKGIGDLTKLMGKLDFESVLKDHIIKPAGAPTLVPESDKRKEINSAESVKAQFDGQ